MKFSKVSQLVLVSVLGLAAASLLSGCLIVTIDYVYVACASSIAGGSGGQIQIFASDAESGALRPVDTAIASGGSNPVSLATSSDYANLYAANQGNNSLVHFAIAGDGSLTQKDTATVPFTPTAIAVNTADTFLFVVGTNPGTLAVYSLSSGAIGSLAAKVSLTLSTNPNDVLAGTGVDVLADNASVYVSAWDQSAYNPGGTVTSSVNPGWVFGYAVGSNGGLTAVSGSPYQAGVKPSGIASDPTNRFVYVTDYASNQLIGYTVQDGGVLNYLINGPFKTASQPSAVVVDPRGLYIYASNSLSSTVSPFSIALPTGTPSAVAGALGAGAPITDTDPVSILVDPGLGRYVYTANYLGNTISGFDLNPNTGVLKATQDTPYPTGSSPTALAAVPHGNHAVATVTP